MKAVNQVGSLFLRSILRRMKELGVSQTELAKRMNASRPYVVKVLHGEVNVTLASAARFAHALQMDFIPVLTPRGTGSCAFELLDAQFPDLRKLSVLNPAAAGRKEFR